jgi:hypothetical protein
VTEADSTTVPAAVIVRPAATVAAAPAPAACSQAGHQQEDHGGPLGVAEPAQHQRGEIANHLFHRRPGDDLLASQEETTPRISLGTVASRSAGFSGSRAVMSWS